MLVVIIKERQTDLTWMLLYYCIVVAGRGNLGYGKSGTYTVQQARNPKDGLIGIQLKRNSAILPRSTDTTLTYTEFEKVVSDTSSTMPVNFIWNILMCMISLGSFITKYIIIR